MIVLDASALLEVLFNSAVGERVSQRLRDAETICAPHLLIVECLQVLRRFEHRGEIDATAAGALLDDLLDFDIDFYDHDLLAKRIWELRANLTAYDATYVALAELLGVPMVTTDAKIAGAPGHRAVIELFAPV